MMAKTKPVAKKTQSKNVLKAKNGKFGTYSNASLQAALQAIRETGISVREASRRYGTGIPRATVHDKFTGKSSAEKKKTGPPPILSVEGEKKIADWAVNIAKCGFPISKTDLMGAVAKIAADAGKSNCFPNGEPGIRWYKGFLKRHPEISQREAEGINKGRALITEESIRLWFCNLRKYLEDNNFEDVLEDPSRIFNGDESGFSLCPKTGKVLGPKGWKNLYIIKSGKEKENITVLITFNASGAICPPLVVFPYVRPPKALVENVPMNWVIGKSDSGWMTGQVFFEYISNEFNSWLTRNEIKRPILLLIDGHKSHMTLPLSQFCEQHNIILYALPPNTTHILQPADVSVFKPMMQEWKTTVKTWQKRPENSNQIITKINFCKVFEEALQNTQMQSHIIKGFRKCGLYPFNPNSVDYTKCVKNFLEKMSETQLASTSAPEQTLSINDFDVARRVIESISSDLKNYGVNVDVVITEIDFQISLLKSKPDRFQPTTSTATSADDDVNIAVGSIVPMDHVTLLPVEIMEIEEGALLNFDSSTWINSENAENNDNIDKEATVNENQIASKKEVNICQNKILTLAENKEECRNKKENGKENKIYTEKDKEIENEAENKKGNKRKTGSGKIAETEIERDKQNKERDDEKNDKENKQPNQQGSSNESKTETEEVTHINNKQETLDLAESDLVEQTETTTTVKLNISDIHDISSSNGSNGEPGKTKEKSDIVDKNKETIEYNNKEEGITPDPFEKHLVFPEASLKKKEGSRLKEKLPSAISSAAWRAYYTRKDDEKKEKIEKANLKRRNKEENKNQNKIKVTSNKSKKKVTCMDTNSQSSSKRKDKVLCTLCEDELFSDAEDDEDKNIGCDECPRWYHLKCTDMADLTYNDAAQKDYVCDICR